MISIVSYGVGNVSSVANMVRKVGGEAHICTQPSDLLNGKKIILPGVGAFDHGMQMLKDGGWIEVLNHAVIERKIPILGICLGMQLMCLSSEEGILPGLGWIDADVKRFKFETDSKLKIPHMGWNTITISKNNHLLTQSDIEQRFYFVHSYHAVCHDEQDILARTFYGYDFTCAFSKENIYGVQFHPEKSHRFGMQMMKNFVEVQLC